MIGLFILYVLGSRPLIFRIGHPTCKKNTGILVMGTPKSLLLLVWWGLSPIHREPRKGCLHKFFYGFFTPPTHHKVHFNLKRHVTICNIQPDWLKASAKHQHCTHGNFACFSKNCRLHQAFSGRNRQMLRLNVHKNRNNKCFSTSGWCFFTPIHARIQLDNFIRRKKQQHDLHPPLSTPTKTSMTTEKTTIWRYTVSAYPIKKWWFSSDRHVN